PPSFRASVGVRGMGGMAGKTNGRSKLRPYTTHGVSPLPATQSQEGEGPGVRGGVALPCPRNHKTVTHVPERVYPLPFPHKEGRGWEMGGMACGRSLLRPYRSHSSARPYSLFPTPHSLLLRTANG